VSEKNKSFPVRNRDFRTTSWSSGRHVHCVEVAVKSRGVAVRDGKNRSSGTLFFNRTEWRAFVRGIKGGEFEV